MTEPKDWQHGYDLGELKDLAAFWKDHDGDCVVGQFARMSEAAVAEALHKGQMVRGYDPEGLSYAYVRTHTSGRPWKDWAGVAGTLPKGEPLIRRPAVRELSSVYALAERLADEADMMKPDLFGEGTLWLETWADHPYDRLLLDLLDARTVSTKVKASSELVALSTTDHQFQGFVDRPPVETVGLMQVPMLPVLSDVLTMAREAALSLHTWADHYSGYNVRKSWTAAVLRGYGGQPDYLIKPAEMSKGWKAKHRNEVDHYRLTNTPLWGRMPAVGTLLEAAFPGASLERVRLMRLAPGGGELTRHADITDPDAGVEVGKLARMHLPLVTNPDVQFWSWGPDGNVTNLRMTAGRWHYLDTRKPHRAVNGGDQDRIHLVADVVVNHALRARLEAAAEEVT